MSRQLSNSEVSNNHDSDDSLNSSFIEESDNYIDGSSSEEQPIAKDSLELARNLEEQGVENSGCQNVIDSVELNENRTKSPPINENEFNNIQESPEVYENPAINQPNREDELNESLEVHENPVINQPNQENELNDAIELYQNRIQNLALDEDEQDLNNPEELYEELINDEEIDEEMDEDMEEDIEEDENNNFINHIDLALMGRLAV